MLLPEHKRHEPRDQEERMVGICQTCNTTVRCLRKESKPSHGGFLIQEVPSIECPTCRERCVGKTKSGPPVFLIPEAAAKLKPEANPDDPTHAVAYHVGERPAKARVMTKAELGAGDVVLCWGTAEGCQKYLDEGRGKR